MVAIQPLLRLTRFWNLLIIGLSQYFTAGFLISRGTIDDPKLLFLVVSTMMIAAAGYSINDYYDIKIDLINKPSRVVIGKGITRRYALLIHTLLSISGTGLGFFLDWRIGLFNFMSAFFLWLYSNQLKRLPFIGNFIVALLTGLSIFIVNVLYLPPLALVWVYSLFAFFMTLVREIIKDMEDLQGDDTFGCKTLPIVWGLRKTKLFTYLLMGLFTAVVIGIHEAVTPLPVAFFLGFLFVPMGLLLAWLVRADTRKDFYRLSQFCKVIMLAGIISMAFL